MGVQVFRSKRLILLYEKRARRTTKIKLNCPPPSVPPPEALYEGLERGVGEGMGKGWGG